MNDEVTRDRQQIITGDRMIKVLKKNLLIIIASALLCFGGAYAYMSMMVAPRYYAGAKFYIESSAGNKTGSGDINQTRLLAETFIEILNTNNFFKLVRSNLPLQLQEKYDSATLLSMSRFNIQNNTEVVLVSVSSLDMEDVIPIVTAVLASMQPHLDIAYGECSCHIVDTPESVLVSSSKTNMVSAVALLAGALLVYAIVLIRDLLDVHVRNAEDVVERYGIPILGTVPSFTGRIRKKGDADNGKSE